MSTIQQTIDSGVDVHVSCYACHHHVKLDLQALKARLGPEHGAMHDDLVFKMRCSKCGGKNVGLTVIPNYKGKDVNPFERNSNGGEYKG